MEDRFRKYVVASINPVYAPSEPYQAIMREPPADVNPDVTFEQMASAVLEEMRRPGM